MFCGKCGAENPDDNLFCGKCGNPFNGNVTVNTTTPLPVQAPIKKKHTGLIISIAIVLILAIAAAIVFLVIKPFDKGVKASAGYSSPEEVSIAFMKAACKGNSDEMFECAPPKLVELYGSELRKSTDEFKDILDKGGKIEYELDNYRECNSSYYEMYSEILVNDIGLDSKKIDEIGEIEGTYTSIYDSYDEVQIIRFTLLKYDGKWYVLDFARIYSGNSGEGY